MRAKAPAPLSSNKTAQNGHAADYFTLDDILNADDIATQDISVPEWGNKKLRIKALTSQEAEAAGKAATETGPGARPGQIDQHKLNTMLFIASVVDPQTNKPLFQMAHYPLLKEKSALAMGRVLAVIFQMNGLTAEAVKQDLARFQDGPGVPVDVPAGESSGDDGA